MRYSIDGKILDRIGVHLDRPIIEIVQSRPSEIMHLVNLIRSDMKEIKEEKNSPKKEAKNEKV